MKLDHYLLNELEENERKSSKPSYSEKEIELIWRLTEYRDNYIHAY